MKKLLIGLMALSATAQAGELIGIGEGDCVGVVNELDYDPVLGGIAGYETEQNVLLSFERSRSSLFGRTRIVPVYGDRTWIFYRATCSSDCDTSILASASGLSAPEDLLINWRYKDGDTNIYSWPLGYDHCTSFDGITFSCVRDFLPEDEGFDACADREGCDYTVTTPYVTVKRGCL